MCPKQNQLRGECSLWIFYLAKKGQIMGCDIIVSKEKKRNGIFCSRDLYSPEYCDLLRVSDRFTMTTLTPISLLGAVIKCRFFQPMLSLCGNWKRALSGQRHPKSEYVAWSQWTRIQLTSAPPATLAGHVHVIHTLNPQFPRFTRFKSLGRPHPLLTGPLGTIFCQIDIPVTVVVLLNMWSKSTVVCTSSPQSWRCDFEGRN